MSRVKAKMARRVKQIRRTVKREKLDEGDKYKIHTRGSLGGECLQPK